ncbi:hypothetical protein Glove_344g47 [Diversispora epigaea]|uniref:Uncharacterized protein n=1 Tax=Diversispora epigaea TaxID=1348612 RepID=A0A397HG98_9GLOM|nr:hypothetical protein Glove_344g47 [Diversispora epigaea]
MSSLAIPIPEIDMSSFPQEIDMSLPFPMPEIDVNSMVQERLKKKGIRNVKAGSPFTAIYLKVFREVHRDLISNIPSTIVSKLASSWWSLEKKQVKDFCENKFKEYESRLRNTITCFIINKYKKSDQVTDCSYFSLLENTYSNPPNTIYPPPYDSRPQLTDSNSNTPRHLGQNSAYSQHLNINSYSAYPNPQLGNADSNPPNAIYPNSPYDSTFSDHSNTVYSPRHLDQDSAYSQHLNINSYSAYPNPQLGNTDSNPPNAIYLNPPDSSFSDHSNTSAYPNPHLGNTDSNPPNAIYLNRPDSSFSDHSNTSAYPNPHLGNTDSNPPNAIYLNRPDSSFSDHSNTSAYPNPHLGNTDSNPPNAIYLNRPDSSFSDHSNTVYSPRHLNINSYSAYPNPQLGNTDSNPPNAIYLNPPDSSFSDHSNTVYSPRHLDQDSAYSQHLNINSYSACPNPQLGNTDSNPPNAIYPNSPYDSTFSDHSNTVYSPRHLDQDSAYSQHLNINPQLAIYPSPPAPSDLQLIYSPRHLDINPYSAYPNPQLPYTIYPSPPPFNTIYSPQHLDQNSAYPRHLNNDPDPNSLYITHSNYNYQYSAYPNHQLENTIYSSSPYQDSAYIDQNSLCITYYQDSSQLEN